MCVRIAFLIDSFVGPWAGTERQLWYLLQGLDRRRFEPVLIALRHSEYSRNIRHWPCEFTELGLLCLGCLKGARSMARLVLLLRKRRVEIVHAYFHDASLIGPLVARLAGARYIAGRRDMGIWYTPAGLKLLKLERRLVDRVIANSHAVKELVAHKEGIARERITVIKNGIEPVNNSNSMVQNLDDMIPEDAPVLGIVANLRSVKRHADLISAFARVMREMPGTHLVIAGDGELDQPLRKLAVTLDVDKNIHFLGKVDNVAAIIRRFTVGVLCSESEGLSNALMEYLGAGIPVVCTDTGGNPELVIDGKNGYLYPVGDTEVLADRILRLLKNKELSRSMGKAAACSIASMSVENMVDSHMLVYQSLVR